jgi:FkbM family methyltransferase
MKVINRAYLSEIYDKNENLKMLYEVLTDIKGIRNIDELTYLIVIVRVIIKKTLRRDLLPAYLASRDFLVKVKSRERSIFYCPAKTDALLHIMPYFERRTWEVMKSIIKRGDVFIDVGAYIGTYSIAIAHKVGPSGIVISLEPSPMYHILCKNIKINRLENCIALKKAAWSKSTHLELYYNPQRAGTSSFFKEWQPYVLKSIKVEAKPLDDILEEVGYPISKIKLLKIDVEGSEVEVLKGASNTISITDYIIFETSKRMLNDCLQLLSSNFKVSFIEGTGPTYNFLACRINQK